MQQVFSISRMNQISDGNNQKHVKNYDNALSTKYKGKRVSKFHQDQFNPFRDKFIRQKCPFAQGKLNINIYRIQTQRQIDRRIYAYKHINFEYFYEQEKQNIPFYIQRELYYLQNINSDHCVKYYAIQIKQNSMIIYLQYCQGWNNIMTLKQYLKSSLYMSPADSISWQRKNVQIILQLFMAVKDLNQKYLIHKDIKPQNILFKKNGSIRLTDFDISALCYRQNYDQCGTIGYRPRQLQIDRTTYISTKKDPLKIDIWSLGFIMYELFQTRKSEQKWPYNISHLIYKYQKNQTFDIFNQINILQNKYIPFQMEDQKLSFIPTLTQKMLAINNQNRISFSQIYSKVQFFNLIEYVVQIKRHNKIFNFLQHDKILQIHTYNQFYQQLNCTIEEISNNQQQYKRLYRLYFFDEMSKLKVNSVVKLLKNVRKIRKQQQKNPKMILRLAFQILNNMKQIYKKGRLQFNHDQQYAESFQIVSSFIAEIKYLYRASFGQILNAK